MKQPSSFSQKIIRIYLIGAGVLLAFYIFVFHAGIMVTENTMSEKRLNMVSTFHFDQIKADERDVIVIDPLLSLYPSHALLPSYLESKIPSQWTGTMSIILDDDREFKIVAQQVFIDNNPQVAFLVETSGVLEWDDLSFVAIQLSLAIIGVILFLITAYYMTKSAKRIASPFSYISERLENDAVSNFEQINPIGERSKELDNIVDAINVYRSRIAIQMEREKSFTRYVSHELRTPMTIIKAALSNLKQHVSNEHSKPIVKITKATDQMHELTHTFLLLARDEGLADDTFVVDELFVDLLSSELADVVKANLISYKWQLKESFELNAHFQLVHSIIINLLKNAFSCSLNGDVSLFISSDGLEVVDNGIGLESKPRGYEGFGIGLVLVKDICQKYNWTFRVQSNPTKGCTASVVWSQSQTCSTYSD